MKLIDADALNLDYEVEMADDWKTAHEIANHVKYAPVVDAVPVVRCKDCKHRPTIDGEHKNGFDIIFPDMRCPCQCEDGWYNWMPEDDWFCGNGERK